MKATEASTPIASPQQLQLARWVSERDWQAVDAMLSQADPQRKHPAGWLLRAELSAFHGYRAEQSWQQLLKQAVNVGLQPAMTTALFYHCWSNQQEAVKALQSALQSNRNLTPKEAETLWQPDWHSWPSCNWQPLSRESLVNVESSTIFLPPLLGGIICHTLAPHLKPAAVIDPTTGQPIEHPIRKNNQAQWLPEQLGWLGKLVEQRLAEAAGFNVNCGEVLNLLHYAQGQEYRLHVDSLPSVQVNSEAGRTQGAQRETTVLLALNDNYKGGTTDFPKLDISAKLKPGQLLRFTNSDATGASLSQSLHTGSPVTDGEKWLLSKWVRQQPTPYAGEINLQPE